MLFDYYLDAGHFKSAREALRTIKQYGDRDDYLVRALRLSIAEKQGDRACKHLERICADQGGPDEALEFAVDLFADAGWERRCESVLWKKLAISRGVGKQWVRLVRGRHSWKGVIERIERLPNRDPRKANVLLAVTEALAREGKLSRMRSLLKRHEPLLRSRNLLWGMVGHYFSLIHDDHGVVEWMHDWRDRRGVQSWMLLNLALALTGLKRFDESQAVHRYALEQTRLDYTHPFHETWLAFGAALAEDVPVVQDFFTNHEVDELDPNHGWIAALARAVLTALTVRDKTRALARAKKHLMGVAGRLDPIDRDDCFVVAYRMASKRISQICGREWGTPRTILPKRG
jgi:hypothetical protein